MRWTRDGLNGPWMDADGAGGETTGETTEASPTAAEGVVAGAETPAADEQSRSRSLLPYDSGDAGTGEQAAGAEGATVETSANATSIPLDRHESVVSNLRRDFDDLQRNSGWAGELDRDRVYRALAAFEGQEAETAATKPPEPDQQDERGNLFFSPGRAAEMAEFVAQRAVSASEQRMEARLGKLEATGQQQTDLGRAEANIVTASAWPEFTNNLEPITAAIDEAKTQRRDLSLPEAYIQVVVPVLTQKRDQLKAEVRAEVIADMKRGTTNDVDPARSAPSASSKAESDMSLQELIERGLSQVSAGSP